MMLPVSVVMMRISEPSLTLSGINVRAGGGGGGAAALRGKCLCQCVNYTAKVVEGHDAKVVYSLVSPDSNLGYE